MSNRLFRWILFTCIPAILPLTASFYVHWRARKSFYQAWSSSSELLFFGIIVSASALGDLLEKSPQRWNKFLTFCGCILIFGVLIIAFQYGNFLHSLVLDPQASTYRAQLLEDSWYAVLAVAVLSTLVEALVGWLEDQ